jgi:hypothetical protein
LLYELGRDRVLIQRAAHEPKLEQGTYVLLHRQELDGSWRRAVDMFNTTAPPNGPRSEQVAVKGGSKP